MDKNSPVFLKLQQIERLLDLKKKTDLAKDRVEAFLNDALLPLEDESRAAEFDLQLPINEFTGMFERSIEAIDRKLAEVAA